MGARQWEMYRHQKGREVEWAGLGRQPLSHGVDKAQGASAGLVMQAGTGALALGAKEQSSDSISSVLRVSLEETHFPL